MEPARIKNTTKLQLINSPIRGLAFNTTNYADFFLDIL